MITKKLLAYELDIIDIEEFKEYYYNNSNHFTGTATNSFLKALDIPPKFFKEQPEETQKELLENREIFVREHKKFFDTVIVVVKTSFGDILNATRLNKAVADENYNKLKTIEEVTGKFEHRSFVKDGYTSIVFSDDIKKDVNNKVVTVDFPILLNKPLVIHNALYSLPNDSSTAPVEHIQYLSSETVALTGPEAEYSDAKSAIEDHLDFLSDELVLQEPADILRDPDLVAIALRESGVIPKTGFVKVKSHIQDNAESGLTTRKLELLVLDFDETFTSYKQVTALRSINGHSVLDFLNSDTFKEFISSMEELPSEEL